MYTTAAHVTDELGISTTRSAFVTRLIIQAGAAVDHYCGRTFARASATDIVVVRRGMRSDLRLRLPRWPVLGVTSVTLTDTATLVPSSAYSIESAAAGVLYRADGWSAQYAADPTNAAFLNGSTPNETRYSIAYEAGYDPAEGPVGAPASPLPADLERATIEMVKSLWFGSARDPMLKSEDVVDVGRTEYWVGTTPGASASGLSPLVRGLLDPYRWVMV